MEKKYRLVAIIGKSASGKDTIVNKFCEKYKQVHKKISTTTRPPEDGDIKIRSERYGEAI